MAIFNHKKRGNLLRRFRREELGAYAVEFAMITPLFFTVAFGGFDFGYQMYNRAMLNGLARDLARDGTIESRSHAELDAEVRDILWISAHQADIEITRSVFSDFSSVGKPEPYTDGNGNNRCDNNETYEDRNNSSTWDLGGRSGAGGARDVVVLDINMKYPRIFPVDKLIGSSGEVELAARTVVENQPFARQAALQTTTRQCN